MDEQLPEEGLKTLALVNKGGQVSAGDGEFDIERGGPGVGYRAFPVVELIPFYWELWDDSGPELGDEQGYVPETEGGLGEGTLGKGIQQKLHDTNDEFNGEVGDEAFGRNMDIAGRRHCGKNAA
jgi:hypothetical protein